MNKLTIVNNYGIAPNELLNCKELSLKAKGLFTYLQSKPEGWRFDAVRIARESKDEKASVRTGLRELEEAGYLKRKAVRSEKGMWEGYEYFLYSSPSTDYPSTDKPSTEKRVTYSNKDISNKYLQRKSSSKKEKPFFRGQEMRQAQGKWWVIPEDGGAWLEFAGEWKDVSYKCR